MRQTANEELIHLNRLGQEWKLFNQTKKHYYQLKKEIEEYLREKFQAAIMMIDDVSRRESREQLIQLNLFHNRIEDEFNRVEHQERQFTSKYLEKSREELQDEMKEIKEKISLMIENENHSFSIQSQCENLIETIENEFDRRPIFSTILNEETLRNYRKISDEFYSNLIEQFHRLKSLLNKFTQKDNRYDQRTILLDQRYEQMKTSHETNVEHLIESFEMEKRREEKISTIIEQLNQCEKDLNDRTSMKEIQLSKQIQRVENQFEHIEQMIVELPSQSDEFEEKLYFPSFHSSLKEIQIHSQRVKRLLQVGFYFQND